MMAWDNLSQNTKIGIVVAVLVVIMLLIIGVRSEWKFKCFQRIPQRTQTWDDAVKT